MKVIYKYAVDSIIKTHEGAIPLTVQVQAGKPCIWMQVDTEREKVDRFFRVIGTGHEIPEGFAYVGTFQQEPFVWHLYEKLK